MVLAAGLRRLGLELGNEPFFDTLRLKLGKRAAQSTLTRARKQGINLRDFGDGSLGVSLDEVSTRDEVAALWAIFAGKKDDGLHGRGPGRRGEYRLHRAVRTHQQLPDSSGLQQLSR